MRASTIAIVLTLCFASSVYTAASCDATTLPFLKWLSMVDSSVVVTSPDTTGGWAVCNEVWSTASQVGTCCKVDPLKALFQKRVDIAKAGWVAYMSSLYRFRTKVAKIGKISAALTTAEVDSMRTAGADFATLETAAVKGILDLAKNFETDLATFKTDGKTCFREIAKARANVFCHGCWAHGGAFFTNNADTTKPPLLTYKQTTCNALYSACGSTWRFFFLSNVAHVLAGTISIRKLGKTDAPANGFDLMINPTQSIDAASNYVYDCTTYKVEGTCTQFSVDKLCSAFFSYSGEERFAREQKDDRKIDEYNVRRVLAVASYDAGSAASSSTTGIDLSVSVTMPVEAEIDTSKAGDSPPSSGSFAKITMAALSLSIALLAVLN